MSNYQTCGVKMLWFVAFLLFTNVVSVMFLLNRVNHWYDAYELERRQRQANFSLYQTQLTHSGELRQREVAALGRESLANLKMTRILEIITGEAK